jgi:HEAT repeat protein
MPLIRLLDNHHDLLRREAARALGQRQVPLATDALSRLLDDASAEVRLEAAIALGRIGDLQAVPALAARLNDPDSYVAFAARVALRRIANWDALAEQLQHTDPTLRLALIDVLDGQYHPGVADILIRILRERDRPAGDRSRALQIAAELARRPRPWDGSWWGTRPAAAGRPPHSEDWEATPRLLPIIPDAIDDPEPSVRRAAIVGVVRNEHRDAAPQLMARFTMESDPEIRRELAQAFGRLRYAPAVPVLIEAIRDVQTDPQIRSAALDALQAIGAPAIEPLVRLLADPGLQESLQPDLINALGKSRASETVPVLLTKLTSPSPATRGAAAAALGRAGTKERPSGLFAIETPFPCYSTPSMGNRPRTRRRWPWLACPTPPRFALISGG